MARSVTVAPLTSVLCVFPEASVERKCVALVTADGQSSVPLRCCMRPTHACDAGVKHLNDRKKKKERGL